MVIRETDNYRVETNFDDEAMAHDMGDRTVGEGAYHLVNKTTNVVELKTTMLPQALIALDQYQEVLNQHKEGKKIDGSESENGGNIVQLFEGGANDPED